MNWALLAEDAGVNPWVQLGSAGCVCSLLIWVMTRGFPSLLERHDSRQTRDLEHFEKILEKIEASRAKSAADGHDAAKSLGSAMADQAEAIRENTMMLSDVVSTIREKNRTCENN